MFQITFLGTGATVPSATRGLSSLLVEHGEKRFLVDCGEGTLRQIREAEVGIRRIDTILLTHGHLDHVLGLASLAATLELWDQGDRLAIYGGEDALRIAKVLLDEVVWPEGHAGLEITYHLLEPGPVLEAGGLSVTAFPVSHHGTDSHGFLFEERGRRHLDEAKLDALGIPAGPDRSRLARGEPVRLADGGTVTPEDVLGPEAPGARLAVVGDTERCDALAEHVRGADMLVIEATYRSADEPVARRRDHLTIKDAAELAKAAGVRRLVLTHQSDRYDPAEVQAEAERLFPGVRVAKDFDRVRVDPRAT